MTTQLTTATIALRIWQEERLGRVWRCAFDDGEGEIVVSFPDTAALGDFIAEQVGLQFEEEERYTESVIDYSQARVGGRPFGLALV